MHMATILCDCEAATQVPDYSKANANFEQG